MGLQDIRFKRGHCKTQRAEHSRERVMSDGVNSDVVKGDVVKSEDEASKIEAEEGD
jgi:hypothetical protein